MRKTETIVSCRQLIAIMLPVRYPTLDKTAELLGLPVRTLQRRLKQDGVSYRKLVEEYRRESACELLRMSGLRVAEIGDSLGYSDPASFTRAFHRWTGMSPCAYRQNQG